MIPDRYVYRFEPGVEDPKDNPIRSIMFDRQNGNYNLLNQQQSDIVLTAIEGNIPSHTILAATKPFPVSIDLTTLENNVQIIDNRPGFDASLNILTAPVSVYQEVSFRCNLSCKDCYQGKREIASPLTSHEIGNLIEKYSNLGVFIIRLTGKEPTTNKDLLDHIKNGNQKGLKMALNTNGVFKPEYGEELVHAGIKEVVVSLDGPELSNDEIRGKGVYKKAVANLTSLTKMGIDTRINMTISRRNVCDIEAMASLAHDIGTYVSYIPMRNLGNATDNLQNVLLTPQEMYQVTATITRLRQKYSPTRLLTYHDILGEKPDYYHPLFQMEPCHARKNIFVDVEANVYPCDHLVGLGDTYKGGNLRNTDLNSLWQQGSGLQSYRKLQHDNHCKSCDHLRNQCHGGCPSEYLVANHGKTASVTDRLCFVDLI